MEIGGLAAVGPARASRWEVPLRLAGILAAGGLALLLVAGATGAGVAFVLRQAIGLCGTVGSGCDIDDSPFGLRLSAAQQANARVIVGVARSMQLPPQAAAIGLMAAMQESHLVNLPYGDLDSVGLFQQRPSQGWGTRDELGDPTYAATQFFRRLVQVPDYLTLAPGRAAQEVQRSADGTAYDRWRAFGARAAGLLYAEPAEPAGPARAG